jgi:nucleotide-binding universal stress UspA family protein
MSGLPAVGFVAIGALAGLSAAAGAVFWRWQKGRTLSAAVMARRSVSAVKRILVPVHGSAYNDRAVELACRLGADQKAEIIAACVIEVPLALSLSAPLPPEEERAEQHLARAAAIIDHHGLTARTEKRRERDVARGILKVAQELQVGMVVLGINPRNLAAGESVGHTTEELLRRSHIEVIVDMLPLGPHQ